MITELTEVNKVVGAKQTRRALKNGKATKIFIAMDADPKLLQPMVQEAVHKGVRIEQVETMKQLGEICGISIGAAIVAVVSQ